MILSFRAQSHSTPPEIFGSFGHHGMVLMSQHAGNHDAIPRSFVAVAVDCPRSRSRTWAHLHKTSISDAATAPVGPSI